MSSLSIIVMASGFSSRFGKDNKLLMPLGNMTVIEQTLLHCQEANISKEIILVTQYDEIAELAKGIPGLRTVMNTAPDKGISESIRLGVQNAMPCDGYMFIPGDQVLLMPESIEYIAHDFYNHPQNILIPAYDGVFGSPKVFPANMKQALTRITGDQGGRQLINTHQHLVRTITMPFTRDHIDIDTYESYLRIREEFQ